MPSPAAADTVGDINFLREWREPVDRERLVVDAVGSLAINLLLFVSVVSMRGAPAFQIRRDVPDLRKVTHLVAPKFYEPTQKAPNKGKVSRELDVNSMHSAPARQEPQRRARQLPPGPIAVAPATTPTPVIEQPKLQIAASEPPPPVAIPKPQQPIPQAAAPQPEPAKPKLSFESVESQSSRVQPVNPVQFPMPNRAPGAGGTIVGDIGDSSTTIPNLNSGAAQGRVGSNLQLLSDPKGVDFRPYLVQILAAVRRNWLTIIPETAKMGRRGRVVVQFAVDRTGGVPKLVIAEGAGPGGDSLDRAAVSAISASYPFPPLPLDYKGDQIRVQLAFSYNQPSR